MSKLLFRLSNVPDDEAQEVRELMANNDIDIFETSAGNWGISMPALWLKKEEQFELASELLTVYQTERTLKIRAQYEVDRERGEIKTLWSSFVGAPSRFILYMGLIGVILYLSLSLFLSFG
ncbi:MAG: DUF6164 family protein [Gammaproteobacteria bacterium]|nr:hypothetical protein [Gammaproteobacteria bacterium]MDP6096206.1 DUF6164 family protein [Gammaproteobacteria bacterium]HJO12016.1 DUF6164 family protein [Gammaproteobacteria bacterium]|tara:strand:- start:858 stop:1220 length:363 start_codon:yes stop_codon:yes gene_type:complete